MAKYIFKRMLSLIPVLIVVSLLVFLMVHMMPGDPARLIAGEQATTEDVERIRVAYGYDKPLYVQYLNMLGVSFRGISAHLQELAGLWRKNWQYVIPILFYWQPHLPLWQS